MMPALTSQETKQLLAFQTNEITEHHIYHQLSLLQKNEHNRRILTALAAEESGHYQLLNTYTQKEKFVSMFGLPVYSGLLSVSN